MNNVELKRKVYSVVNNILKEKIYISPVDVLMGVGILSVKDYECDGNVIPIPPDKKLGMNVVEQFKNMLD